MLIVTHLGDPRKADTVLLLGGCALLCPEASFLHFLMRPTVLACPEALFFDGARNLGFSSRKSV